MLDKVTTMKQPGETAAGIAAELGRIEINLHKARAGIGKVEGMLKEARAAGLAKDGETMAMISRLGMIAGQIAAAEGGVYGEHAVMTQRAIERGVDTGGPLAVLTKFQPAAPTGPGAVPFDGGDR